MEPRRIKKSQKLKSGGSPCKYFPDSFGVSEVSRKNKKGGVIIPDDNIT